MIDERTVKEVVDKLEKELVELLPKWRKARDRFNELDTARIDKERDLMHFRERLDDIAREQGLWHDQMAYDFSIEKHGRNKKLVGRPKHGEMYPLCECRIQCPVCKKYTIAVRYLRKMFGDDKGKIIEKERDGILVGDYWVCKKCAKEMRK